jgi:hypothetical protein
MIANIERGQSGSLRNFGDFGNLGNFGNRVRPDAASR